MYLFIMIECLCSFSMIDNVSYIAIYLILLYSGIRCICSGNHHISPHNWYGTFNYILTVNNWVTCNTFTDTCSEIDSITFKHVNIRLNCCNIYIIYHMDLNTVDSQFHGDHVFWDDRLCSKHILRIKCSSLWLSNLLYFCVRHMRILPYNIIYRVFIRISWLGVFLYVYNYRSESHNEISEIQ